MPDASALLPGTTPASIPTIQQLDEELKPKQISQAAEEFRLKIEWRKLRNQVQNDPTVKAAFAAADKARNDLDKRALLRRCFNLMYDKMIALGRPEMRGFLNDRRREQLAALPQPRVRPTPKPAVAPTLKSTSRPAAIVSPSAGDPPVQSSAPSPAATPAKKS